MVLTVFFTVLALFFGGVLKGATGAGAPLIVIPVLAMLFDVPFAVVLFAMPNMVTNIYQSWGYRQYWPSRPFVLSFAGGGVIGAAVGTVMLATLASDQLLLIVALVVFLYIGFRLMRPDWKLDFGVAQKLAAPAGFLGGALQGATGISAPISVTFLNAIRLERTAFIGTIAVFFLGITFGQVPLQFAFGLMTGERFLLSVAAIVPLMLGMPVGAWLARRISADVFDRIILILLAVIAVKLVLDALL